MYFSTYFPHQIQVYKSQTGKLLARWGVEDSSSKQGEFNYPMGITVDNKYVYVCDSYNHRVELLTKKGGGGMFCHQWGKGVKSNEPREFAFPNCIFNDELEEIFYIGDNFRVQWFTKDGVYLQHLGGNDTGSKMNEFNVIYGVSLMDDRLYVCDRYNERIQIFKRATK